jgi:hypothetical protein
MKITPTPLKVKLQVSEAKDLLNYLKEIVDHFDEYSKTLLIDKLQREILRYNFQNLLEKLTNKLFSHIQLVANPNIKNFLFTITYGERLTLFKFCDYYPLPVQLSHIEYSFKNGLIL